MQPSPMQSSVTQQQFTLKMTQPSLFDGVPLMP
jgi:hypothetical protein